MFLTSAGASVTSRARRRVRLLGLCSSRWFRFARRRITLPVAVSRNRFPAPLWGFIFGMVAVSVSCAPGARRLLRLVARLIHTPLDTVLPRAGGATFSCPHPRRPARHGLLGRPLALPRRLSLRARPPVCSGTRSPVCSGARPARPRQQPDRRPH